MKQPPFGTGPWSSASVRKPLCFLARLELSERPQRQLGAASDPSWRLCELCSLHGLEQVGRMVLAIETSS